ncbi:MAG: TonB-dependent receptor, partial [Methyloglobulus sp.]|nr:TonB-dependent receptor [Methyloglobulus sp.]
AGTLNEALTDFADKSDIKLVYNADLVRGIKSPPLNGRVSVVQGFNTLLKGSNLNYRMVGNNTVVIEHKPKAQPAEPKPNSGDVGGETTLEKVTVEADAGYDPDWVKDPYNQDYVLPNATSGTKTDTPIMETPLNVQVISKQVLKDQQVINLGQALKNVSGVTTSNNPGSFAQGNEQILFLRGFESQTFFRNGFRLQQGAASRAMANVESVEVLKGSAAILYGLVEPGGMVNVITKQPLATPYYGLTQQFGSYDLYRTTIDATAPLTKNKDLLYRMNMSYENSGSFRQFVDKEDVFVSPVLKWIISPRTQATFEMEYNHQHIGQTQGFIPAPKGNFITIPRSLNYGEYSPATTETIFGSFNWSHQFNDDWSIKHSLSINQQEIISASVRPESINFAGNTVQRVLYDDKFNYNTYSTNLDLIGHFDTFGLHHTLLFGGDYYRLDTLNIDAQLSTSDIALNNPVHPGTPFTPQSLFIQNPTKTDQYGLYVQEQIKLPYGFQVMGGIRYQYIHSGSTYNTQSPDGATSDSNAETHDAVTPRVGILWQPKSWLSLYANYVESFGANTPGARLASGEPVPPTGAEQYEGGIKTEFFNGRLRATLAYYDLTKTNIANALPFPPNVYSLTGAARSRGPEIDIQGEILPGWNLIGTYTNMETRVLKASDTSGFSPLEGSRLWGVSRNVGSLWSTYEVQNGDFKGFKFGSGVTLRDGQTGCCSKPASSIPGYATVDLLAAYSREIGKAKVTAQLNVNNLLDKHYFSSHQLYRDFNEGYVEYGQPRTFMGSITVQY